MPVEVVETEEMEKCAEAMAKVMARMARKATIFMMIVFERGTKNKTSISNRKNEPSFMAASPQKIGEEKATVTIPQPSPRP